MHLFKPLHHWNQKTGLDSQQSTPYLQTADFNKFFCTALFSALKFTAGTQHCPTDLFILSLQLSLSPSCSAVSHGLASPAVPVKCSPGPEDVGLPWPLAPSHCRAGEWSPTSSPNDVTCMRASHLTITFGLVPKC